MRIFADAAGKMNLALAAVGGELLVVSQFTLLADTTAAAAHRSPAPRRPTKRARLYEQFLSLCRASGDKNRRGRVRRDDGSRAGQRRPGDDHPRQPESSDKINAMPRAGFIRGRIGEDFLPARRQLVQRRGAHRQPAHRAAVQPEHPAQSRRQLLSAGRRGARVDHRRGHALRRQIGRGRRRQRLHRRAQRRRARAAGSRARSKSAPDNVLYARVKDGDCPRALPAPCVLSSERLLRVRRRTAASISKSRASAIHSGTARRRSNRCS